MKHNVNIIHWCCGKIISILCCLFFYRQINITTNESFLRKERKIKHERKYAHISKRQHSRLERKNWRNYKERKIKSISRWKRKFDFFETLQVLVMCTYILEQYQFCWIKKKNAKVMIELNTNAFTGNSNGFINYNQFSCNKPRKKVILSLVSPASCVYNKLLIKLKLVVTTLCVCSLNIPYVFTYYYQCSSFMFAPMYDVVDGYWRSQLAFIMQTSRNWI